MTSIFQIRNLRRNCFPISIIEYENEIANSNQTLKYVKTLF